MPGRARIGRHRTCLLTAAVVALAGFAAPASAHEAAHPTAGPAAHRTADPAAHDATHRATGSFDQRVLFRADQDPGYACFRIPAVVRSTSGTLLAFAEGRVDNCGDAGDIDLVVKRSTDGGRTWGPLRVVNPGNGDTHGNPVPVVDATTGRILLITTYNAGRDDSAGCAVPCPRTPHLQYSDDDGRTWSAPRDISAEADRPGWDSWYASGPVHGIQLTVGPHAGRLVFGVNAETSDGAGHPIANHAALVYSDDHGAHWHIGATDTYRFPAGGTFTQKPSEVSVVQLPNGDIYAGGREQGGTDIGNRDYAISRDGGQTFSTRFTTIPDLVTPMVQGSLLRVGHRILFASPSDTDRRRWMMIRSSFDNGRTWQNADQGTRITDDWSGYSDLVRVGGDTIGLLYEGGALDARDEIRFARFDLAYLGGRDTPGPATPDVSGHHADAHLLGGPATTTGRYGGALDLDGADDFLRVPYDPSQPTGDGDFTWSAWFRYGASTGPQALLWTGGMNGAPQVWLRGEPSHHRMIALMTTPAGTAWIASADAYADRAWHHVALERHDGRLSMWVDDDQVADGAEAPGSVSQTVSYQIELGQRLDGAYHLDGALDEVRIYRRALSPTELSRVRANAAVPGDLVLRLPMDHVRRP